MNEASAGATDDAVDPATAPASADTEPGGAPASSRRHSALVTAGIALSRVSGLVREKLLGYFLGAGLGVEAFRAALKIPNLMQNLLGEGVLSASFIPVYARLLAEGDREEAGRVAGAVAGLLAAVSGALVVIGVVFAAPLTTAIAPGFAGEKYDLTVTLVRILTPGIGFLVLSAWCLGILNSHRRFFLSYVAPVLWNAAMITALVAFGLRGWGDQDLAVALAWGTFAGGILQFAVQLPAVIALTRGLRPSLDVHRPGVRRVVRAFGPVVAGRGVVQLTAYVDLILASLLATGAVAALGFAQVLYVLPISLFGMSVAAAELPELSSLDAVDRRAIAQRLQEGLARIAFYVVPSLVAFLTIGDLIVGLLYQGGEFGRDTTLQVWVVLAAYSVGLLPSTAARLLQSSLYGVGDTTRPAVIAAVRVVFASVLGLVLMFQFDAFRITVTGGLERLSELSLPRFSPASGAARESVDNLHRLGAAGLTLAAGLGSWLEYALLRRVLRPIAGRVSLGGGWLGKTLTAGGCAAAVGLLARVLVGGWAPWFGAPVALAAVGGVYLGAAWGLRLPEARDLAAVARRRLRR